MNAQIEKLDPTTQSRLRSTQILVSLPQVVSELLQNALDAEATRVDIGLDAHEWMCWVKDNGNGISKNNLDVIGQEGDYGRYATSKAYAQNLMNAESTFGFRGEALASAAELSCLEISSRTAKSKESWSTILKAGKRLYFGPSVRWRKETPGTVVCVRDAFYNLPVRRLSHPSPTKTWDLVRQEVEQYALVSPEVTFSLENSNGSKNPSSKEEGIIQIPKTSSMLAAFQRLYGRSLVENVEEIRAFSGSLEIHGFISLVASYSKNHQHIYINRHPIEVNDFHRVINSCFSQSNFGRTALNEDGERDLPGAGTRRSPRKVEKRPIYVLNICVPRSDVDNCLEPSKNSSYLKHQSSVSRLLSSTVNDFLRKHGFVHSSKEIHDHAYPIPANTNSPKKRRRIETFDDSGFVEADSDIFGHSTSSDYRLVDKEGSITSEPFVYVDGDSTRVPWTDRKTGDSFIIDSRTGNSFRPINQNRLTMGLEGAPKQTPLVEPGQGHKSSDAPDWLSRALEANQAYPVVERRMSLQPSTWVASRSFRGIEFDACFLDPHPSGENSPHSPAAQISREQLGGAQVIAQIDKKFIACLLRSERGGRLTCPGSVSSSQNTGGTLILVDQHAADERIRVESFLRPLCTGFLTSRSGGMDPGELTPIIQLTPPRPVLLTRHEASLLKRNKCIQMIFRHWGISILERSEKGIGGPTAVGVNEEHEQIFVNSLPEVVHDKLLQKNELQELIKNTLGQIQSGTLSVDEISFPPEQTGETDHDWLPALRQCPRSLVELINSKACRGAVMFNDELTQEQCRRLVTQLAQTAFPFQCAHGRPSLIPLTDVNSLVKTCQPRRRCDWKKLE